MIGISNYNLIPAGELVSFLDVSVDCLRRQSQPVSFPASHSFTVSLPGMRLCKSLCAACMWRLSFCKHILL